MFRRSNVELFAVPQGIMDYEYYETQVQPYLEIQSKLYVLVMRYRNYILRSLLARASLADINAAIREKTGKPSKSDLSRAKAKAFNEGYHQCKRDLRSKYGYEEKAWLRITKLQPRD